MIPALNVDVMLKKILVDFTKVIVLLENWYWEMISNHSDLQYSEDVSKFRANFLKLVVFYFRDQDFLSEYSYNYCIVNIIF